MQYRHRVDHVGKIRFSEYSGHCKIEDLIVGTLEAINSDEYNPDYDTLVDLRKCEANNVEPEDIARLVNLIKDKLRGGNGKIAILVDTAQETALTVFYRDFLSDIREVKLFSLEINALKWLGKT